MRGTIKQNQLVTMTNEEQLRSLQEGDIQGNLKEVSENCRVLLNN